MDFNSEDYAATSDYSKDLFSTDTVLLKDTVPGPYPYVPHTQLGHFSVLKVLDSFETQLKSSKKDFSTVWHDTDKNLGTQRFCCKCPVRTPLLKLLYLGKLFEINRILIGEKLTQALHTTGTIA